ncbi:MAG TPA: hypothetical protein VIO61_07670 [Anaerolineaceae bacterium]
MNAKSSVWKKILCPQAVIWLLVVFFLAYAARFIMINIFWYEGKPYFGLFDDAMISMTYARNLAQGNGLVWNAGGERVEGISNPLWAFIMAFFHLFPIPENWMGLPVILLGAGFLVANLFLVRRVTQHITGGEFAPLVAVALTALYYPLNNWALTGTEVSILTWMTTLLVWGTILTLNQKRFFAWIYVLIGIASFVRIDMLGIGGFTWLFLAFFDRSNRRNHLLWGGVILAGFTLFQTLGRYLYYGDWLPNTYYLKMTGGILSLRLERGLYVFGKFVLNFNLALFLIPLLLLFFRRDRITWYMFLVFAVQVGYSIYVGGDAWEHRGGANRFFAIVMPVYFILFSAALESLRQAAWAHMAGRQSLKRTTLWKRLTYAAMAVFASLSLVTFNTLLDFNSLQYAALLKPSVLVGTDKTVVMGKFVKEITTPEARVLVIAAGGLPYYSGRFSYDMLGKSDRVVGKGPMHLPEGISLLNWRPGHNKWNYDYSILTLKPDMITELWWQVPWQTVPAYLKDYTRIEVEEMKQFVPDGVLFVRTGSPNIRWELIQKYIVKN